MQKVTHCLICGIDINRSESSYLQCSNHHYKIAYHVNNTNTQLICLYVGNYRYNWNIDRKTLWVSDNKIIAHKYANLIYIEPDFTNLEKLVNRLKILKNFT